VWRRGFEAVQGFSDTRAPFGLAAIYKINDLLWLKSLPIGEAFRWKLLQPIEIYLYLLAMAVRRLSVARPSRFGFACLALSV